MNHKRFKEIDVGFICLNCNFNVESLGYTSRDHCPNCLYGLHVDINPGDRLSHCKGVLKPVDFEKFKNTYKIIYECQKCQMIRKNILATDDNFEALIKLSERNKL